MEVSGTTVTVVLGLVGFLEAIHTLTFVGLSSKIKTLCAENREDHNKIFEELKLKQSVTACSEKVSACNGSRDKKLEVAAKADDKITSERRVVIDEKIEGIVTSLDNLSMCISKYTKGEC